jgi:hypothetical protein
LRIGNFMRERRKHDLRVLRQSARDPAERLKCASRENFARRIAALPELV